MIEYFQKQPGQLTLRTQRSDLTVTIIDHLPSDDSVCTVVIDGPLHPNFNNK